MPPKSRQSRQNLVEQEGRIQLAIKALKNCEILSIRRVAETFNVPYTTLSDQLSGHLFQGELRNHNLRLSKTQEETLIQWIISRDTRGVAPRPSHVQQMANIILQQDSPTPPKPIGKNWVTEFIKRHDSIKSRFARRYNYSRALCEDPKVINNWFKRLKEVQDKHGIQAEDIYNFDETSFAMGLITTTKVVTRSNMPGRPHLIQPGQREWVTTIECISSTGFSVPTCIIFKGKIGLRWLEKCFIPATTARTKGGSQLLVLDGHGSHLTPEFDKMCKDNNIICIYMPPYSSHLLQPLDVGCFGPLKRAYGGLVEAKMRLGYNYINKLDFLKAYPAARQQVFSIENIQSGFHAAGIQPHDPSQVLDKFNYTVHTPTPPGSRGGALTSSSTLATPYTVHQLHKKVSSVKKMLARGRQTSFSPSKQALDELIKGCEMAIYNTAMTLKELNDLRAESQIQQQKKGRSKRQMSPIAGLQVQEARDLITLRNEQLNVDEGGHSSSTPLASGARKRAPPRCSECGIQGHIRTGCPNRRQT
ncbi:hypothetical protein ASPCAL13688 [Aspergillus calidoustus]|uniref:HTH CENPB-type domain-containing protein n=1 Tax=Aspergillus calidoustus TaxID=454130 RepID=A0A0U5GFA7_ASPCI|nr:hypothetical protein ASPCAL13688 [Aspergillus calidoustus]